MPAVSVAATSVLTRQTYGNSDAMAMLVARSAGESVGGSSGVARGAGVTNTGSGEGIADAGISAVAEMVRVAIAKRLPNGL